MDKRHILCVLLVTLSWTFLGTYAQTTTEAPDSTTITTHSSTMTTTGGTVTVTDSTTMSTTHASSMTTTGATSKVTDSTTMSTTHASSMTTTGGTVTVTDSTTMSTTPASSMTTTEGNGVTNSANMSEITLTSNNTLLPLDADISRDECGSEKLCAAEPPVCDPTGEGDCHYLSVKLQSGQKYVFELSGQSEGYVAAGVASTTAESGIQNAYVCANNNGSVIFFTGVVNNSEISLKELDSSDQQGNATDSKIQCKFTADLSDTTRSQSEKYALSVFTGSYDPDSKELGKANFKISTNPADLTDNSQTLTNSLNSASSSVVTPTFLSVLLVTACMLAFAAM